MGKPDYCHQARCYETTLIQSIEEPQELPTIINIYKVKFRGGYIKVWRSGKWELIGVRHGKRLAENKIRDIVRRKFNDTHLLINLIERSE